MLQTHCNANNKIPIYNQNPIHIDNKWVKQFVTITGSVEASLILADCVIYHRNQYRSFKVDNQQRYGLLTSLSDIQRDYHISYKRAKQVLQDLIDQDFVTMHEQGFIHNRKFYTPTEKALDVVYKLHFENSVRGANYEQNSDHKISNRISIKTDIKTSKSASIPYTLKSAPPLPIDQSTFADRSKSYKDKNKDKKNNNHNYPKNYSLLKNLKAENVKTVIFDFKQFSLGEIESEASLLDYFTVKQNKVISTVIYCYYDTLDITVFNQMLHGPDLKKEAKDFKQLVIWAYVEATGNSEIVSKDKQVEFASNSDVEDQIVNEIVIDYSVEHTIVQEEPQAVVLADVDHADSETQPIQNQAQDYRLAEDMVIDYSVEPTIVEDEIVEDEIVEVAPNADNHTATATATALPELTTADIQTMIKKRQGEAVQDIGTENKNHSVDDELSASKNDADTDIEAKTLPPQSTYLLSQSNKLYLLETLSKQGVNDAQLILKTAENIIAEYPSVTFNDLLDGVVYRLVTLPAKQRQQVLMNQAAPMEVDGEDGAAIDCLEIANSSKPEVMTAEQSSVIESDVLVDVQGVIGEAKPESIASVVIAAEAESQTNQETSTQKEYAQDTKKPIEFPDNFINENPSDCLDHEHEKLLIAALDEAGITDKKLIVETATSIMAEYPELEFKAVVEGVIYRLVTLPEKQRRQHNNQQALLDILTCENTTRPETMTANQMPQTIPQVSESALPTLEDLTMPHVDRYHLRKDWASKADQNFYTGVLPESQQFALVAMIDYVKRQGVTITVDQEVYEWLYHMASNKDYYYSRAKNFKHWCNIVMKQLMARRLNKPAGFNGWRSRIEAETLAVAA